MGWASIAAARSVSQDERRRCFLNNLCQGEDQVGLVPGVIVFGIGDVGSVEESDLAHAKRRRSQLDLLLTDLAERQVRIDRQTLAIAGFAVSHTDKRNAAAFLGAQA